jgi:tetratricopeptide (TPR) repeat protein
MQEESSPGDDRGNRRGENGGRRTMRFAIKLVALLVAVPLFAGPALAMGGGDGSSSGSASKTVQKCKKGQVWDKKRKKCVVPKHAMLDDESIFEAGRDLAYAGRYDEAINVLTMAANKRDPRILNFLGYAHRKSGRVNVGLGYYQEALRIDPNYTLVREYLGEAYLQIGDMRDARGQLAEIEKRKGRDCEEYRVLSAQIDKAEKAG